MNKLNAAVDRIHELERERAAALDALAGMVEQHCVVSDPGDPVEFTPFFLSANERAFAVLVDAGRMEHVGGIYYRMVEEVANEA